ncbi:MAG: TerC family protein, partial [Pseudomonadota bacterium]
LYCDLREGVEEHQLQPADAMQIAEDESKGYTGPPRRTMMSALISITIADVSMSLDNVLAVAAIADGDTTKLVFGLGLAILLMAFAATMIMKLLTKYPWISWLGLAVLLYVASEMMYRGLLDPSYGVLKMMGMA